MKRPLTPREWGFAFAAFVFFCAALFTLWCNVEMARAISFYQYMYTNTVITISPK